MSQLRDDWVSRYADRGALWFHDGNTVRPHALLTSGKHSSGFFNSERVMEDPLLLDRACNNLLYLLKQGGFDLEVVDRVAGPALGAITPAHDLARHIGFARDRPCLRAYAEKDPERGPKAMVFKRTAIRPGEQILLVEDVLTTGVSTEETAMAVVRAGGIVMPFVGVLVNRSGLTEVGDKQIVALIDHPMPMWKAEECPLCKQGSEPLRPKGAENWARLNAQY